MLQAPDARVGRGQRVGVGGAKFPGQHSMRPRYRVPQAQLPLAHSGKARGKDESFPREDGPHGPQPFVGGKPLLGRGGESQRGAWGGRENGGVRLCPPKQPLSPAPGHRTSIPRRTRRPAASPAPGSIPGARRIPGSAGLGGAARAGREPPSRTRSQRPSCRSLILLKPVVKILPSATKMARMGRAPSCGLSFSCAGR